MISEITIQEPYQTILSPVKLHRFQELTMKLPRVSRVRSEASSLSRAHFFLSSKALSLVESSLGIDTPFRGLTHPFEFQFWMEAKYRPATPDLSWKAARVWINPFGLQYPKGELTLRLVLRLCGGMQIVVQT